MSDWVGKRVRFRDHNGRSHTGTVTEIETHQIALVKTASGEKWYISPDKLQVLPIRPVVEPRVG